MALNENSQTGFPLNTSGTLAKVDSSVPVDNVFTYSSAGSVWQRVMDGGVSLFRAVWFKIGGAPTDLAPRLLTALSNPDIQVIEIDTTLNTASAVNFNGKKLRITGGGVMTGAFNIQNAVIEGDPTQQLFDISSGGTITNSKSAFGKWYAGWFGAKGDGVTNDRASLNYANTVASANTQKTISLIAGNYVIGSNLAISTNVNLKFDVGAEISGAFTLSGTGTFESNASKCFGSNVTVSGIYPLNGVIYPQNFGATGDNVTNDSPAIQRMFNYTNTIPNNPVDIFFPAKRYYHADTVYLPKGITRSVPVKISGFGATLRTDQNITIWDRIPADNSEAYTIIDRYIGVIEGFFIEGTSTVASPQNNQIGLKMGAMYSWTFRHLHFFRLYNCLEAQFALQCNFEYIRVTHYTNYGILGRHGTWTGATPFNTSFNANRIVSSRVVSLDGSYCALGLLAADNTVVDDFISEGNTARYDIYLNWAGNTTVNNNTFSNIWFEAVSGTVYPKNTNFYINSPVITNIINAQRDYENYFLELDMAAGGWLVNIEGLQYIVGTPLFKQIGSLDGSIQIRNSRASLDYIFRNPANWDVGVPPPLLFVGPSSSNDPDNIAGLKIYGINLYDSPVAHTFRNYSTNAGIPIMNITSPPSNIITRTALRINLFTNTINANLLQGLVSIYSTSSGIFQEKGINLFNVGDAGGNYPVLNLNRANGTVTTPTIVLNNTYLGLINFNGYTTSLQNAGFISAMVDGTPSGSNVPMRYRFYANSGSTVREVLGIRASGALEIPVAQPTGALTDNILTRTAAGLVREIATSTLIATGVANRLGYFATNGGPITNLAAITANRALISDANGLPIASDIQVLSNNYGFGIAPTAKLTLPAGTATANTAPLKFTAGTILTVAESGVLETDGGNNLFYTNTTAVRGRLQQNRTVVSGAASLAITDNYNHYVFDGVTSTWTLPAVSGTANVIYYIKNRGSGVLTINTTSGNEIYDTAPVNTLAVSAGSALVLFSDGTYYNVE